MNVRELEGLLFSAFPREQAEPWDHVGLSVGDPDAEVHRVLVALDATIDSIRSAHDRGCNVLVTHHPVYLDAPSAFSPAPGPGTPAPAAALWAAIELGVAIVSMHTNLDRSPAARTEICGALGLRPLASLEHPGDAGGWGLGAICELADPMPLEGLAKMAARVYRTVPRVWGDPCSRVARVALLGGSLGRFGEDALRAGADAVVTGEAGYHVAQDIALRGAGVILLGHDSSEFCFINVLCGALEGGGVEPRNIVRSSTYRNWWIPQEEELA